MSPDPITAVFFDFAGTLFNDRDLRDVHLQQLQFVGVGGRRATPPTASSAPHTGRAWESPSGHSARRPPYSHRELFGGAFSAMAIALGGKIDDATAQEAVTRQYQATIDHAALRPDALTTAAALQQAGIHVGIVSNIDDEQLVPMLDRLGLWNVIDAATSSESAGSCKPDAAIYRLAMDKAGVEASQSLFVGDSLGHDVFGPAAVGMRTAWLAPDATADHGDIRPDSVITSLGEVLEIVGVEVHR